MMIFNLRVATTPLERELPIGKEINPNIARITEFEAYTVVHSADYKRILDDDEKDFYIKCLEVVPNRRASVEDLLLHPWIRKNEDERQLQFAEAKEVRLNFANQIKANFSSLESMSEYELDLLRAFYNQNILEEQTYQMEDMFDACDIAGGPDGRISFDEVIKAVDNMNVFTKEANNAGDISLADLRNVLHKVDIFQDDHLDKVEFMLLALDRSILYSEQNVLLLFNSFDTQNTGRISINESVI